ncbi:hypothetical protein VTH06DRAFT_6145 [Thermothelomyces fergusii]
MTGKQLNDYQRAILTKLLQIPKLSNRDIAWVLDVTERTVRRRRDEFEATGDVKKHKDVSKNAEKLKPQHLETLIQWHKEHPDALLEDMQVFLRTQCGLEVSHTTISRQIRKAYGQTSLRNGRRPRRRTRKRREDEGRPMALELQQQPAEDRSDKRGQPATSDLYRDQQQLAPLAQVLGWHHQGPGYPSGSVQYNNPASGSG